MISQEATGACVPPKQESKMRKKKTQDPGNRESDMVRKGKGIYRLVTVQRLGKQ